MMFATDFEYYAIILRGRFFVDTLYTGHYCYIWQDLCRFGTIKLEKICFFHEVEGHEKQ